MSTPPPAGTGRWSRLAADLAAAGIDARVDARIFTETVNGRPRAGTSYSVTLRHPRGGTVEISDAWWAKNPDKWTGWEVTRTGADDIVVGRPVRSKNRGEVVAAVQARLACGDPGCDVTCAVNGCNPTCPCREPARQESNRGLGPRHPEDPN
jgi:hypothetical protein